MSPSHLYAQRVSSHLRFKEKLVKDKEQIKGNNRQKGKKISIEGIELIGLANLQPNLLVQKAALSESRGKVSLADTDSHKNSKQLFRVIGNSHESTVYFSLFKSE